MSGVSLTLNGTSVFLKSGKKKILTWCDNRFAVS